MKGLITLLCMVLAVSIISSVCADTNTIEQFSLKSVHPTYKYNFPIKLGWLIGDYDFDRIEEYIDGYYKNYYKSWEKYLVNKQREFASTFGLTNVIFKPDFRQYENTKLVLSKNVWDNRLAFKYIAPLGDVINFDVSISFKPYRFVTLVGKGNLNGDGSALILINKPFGFDNKDKHTHQKTSRLMKKINKLAKRF